MDPEELKAEADAVRGEDPAEAARLYGEASDLGSPGASSSLGYMLMVGEGVPQDAAKAEGYLRKAVEGGEAKAMCNLGNLVAERDPQEALALFERAGESGLVSGMRNAASVLRGGSGVPADPARAAMWLERAAGAGDAPSAALLAHMLRVGEGVPADKPRAAELYRLAAEARDADSMYDLAMMLDSGDGVPADRAEAEKWFRGAAALGDNDARLCLGGILYERSEFREAESVFTDAALDGDVKAMYNLALMYAEGSLGESDMGKAEEWLECASDAGFAYAQSMLGTILLDRGDTTGAEALLRRAADQGEPTAMYNLGALALSGKIEMGDREAVGLLVRAAEQGVEEARTLLSRLSGRGAIRSPVQQLRQALQLVGARDAVHAELVVPVHYGAVNAEGLRGLGVLGAVAHVDGAPLRHVERRERQGNRLGVRLVALGLVVPDHRLRQVRHAVVLHQREDLAPDLPGGYRHVLAAGPQAAERRLAVAERDADPVRVGLHRLYEPPPELVEGARDRRVRIVDLLQVHVEVLRELRRDVLHAYRRQGVPEYRVYAPPGVEQGVVEVEDVEVVLPHFVPT